MYLESINNFVDKIVNSLNSTNLILVAFLVVGIPALSTFLLRFIYIKSKSIIKDTNSIILAIVKAIYFPISLFIWLISSYIFIKMIFYDYHFMEQQVLMKNIPVILVVTCITLMINRIINYTIHGIIGDKYVGTKANKITVQVIIRLVNALLFISAILFILSLSGVNVSIILIFSGSYFITIVGFVIINSMLRIAYHKIMKRIAQNSHFWVYTIVKSIYMPLHTLVFVEALYVSYKISTFTWKAPDAVVNTLTKFHAIIIVALLAWFFIKFIEIFEEQLLLGRLTKKTPSKTTVQASGKLLRIGMIVVLTLISLPILGIPISGILAFSGGSAIIVGIAVRPILANYLSGILIYSDKFFEVGDWIHSPDQNIEGTVENIGWRSTRIRTFEKQPLYVPNSVFSSISVVNASRMSNRRIKETIGIRYKDSNNLDNITQEVRTMLKQHPEIDTNQTLLVHFTDFGPSSLNVNVYTFTQTRDWKKYRDVQQDVFLKVIEIIEKNGAKLAMPGRNIHLNSNIPISINR